MADVELTDPDHLTADYVGEPGRRTFYLQAAEGAEVLTLRMEKQQVEGLAELLAELLARVESEPASEWDRDAMRLREPLDERWRVGTLSVGVDPDRKVFVIEVAEFVPDDEARVAADARIWVTHQQARELAAHAAWAAQQGRPRCQFCGLPKDPEGHVCPASNGHGHHRG